MKIIMKESKEKRWKGSKKKEARKCRIRSLCGKFFFFFLFFFLESCSFKKNLKIVPSLTVFPNPFCLLAVRKCRETQDYEKVRKEERE